MQRESEDTRADFSQAKEAGQDCESREVLSLSEKMSLALNESYSLHSCLVSYPKIGHSGERRFFLESTLIFSTASRFSSSDPVQI